MNVVQARPQLRFDLLPGYIRVLAENLRPIALSPSQPLPEARECEPTMKGEAETRGDHPQAVG